MRKLASVQVVNTVEPIPNADAIERVRVLGWWVVVKKNEFAVGDAVVYCEIDSLLPEVPAFEFLRKSCYRAAIVEGGQEFQRAGFRIRTVRLRGTPTAEGTDVSDALGVIKHDPPPPANLAGRVKGMFPSFIPKTDETRVQVLEAVLRRHRGKVFNVTEKLDGSSFTAFLRDGTFGVCSRNLLLDESDESHLFVQLAKRLELGEALVRLRDKYGFDTAIQGEVISRAAGVQPVRHLGEPAGRAREGARAVEGDAAGCSAEPRQHHARPQRRRPRPDG
jgi:RNA ligase